MLITRVITAVVLLVVLLGVLFSSSFPAFALVILLFLLATLTESFQLFGSNRKQALLISLFWAAAFSYAFLFRSSPTITFWFAISVALWLFRFVPSLKTGLPPPQAGARNNMLGSLYAISIIGAFAAIVVFFRHSPVYLLSVMAIVWVADVGAYFSGKAFGKRKLAPSISPGKSWEGAIGGGIAVLVLASASILAAGPSGGGHWLQDTFAVDLQAKLGWAATLAILVVLTAASVVGDLFESQLKRRAGVKDSSNLLPGHGGVLDRIDALVPVLPLAALIYGTL